MNMNERDFIYWLQGMLENVEETTLDEKRLKSVKDHLKLVMTKVTPTYPSLTSPHFVYPQDMYKTDTQAATC
jgi:hypothetical protein